MFHKVQYKSIFAQTHSFVLNNRIQLPASFHAQDEKGKISESVMMCLSKKILWGFLQSWLQLSYLIIMTQNLTIMRKLSCNFEKQITITVCEKVCDYNSLRRQEHDDTGWFNFDLPWFNCLMHTEVLTMSNDVMMLWLTKRDFTRIFSCLNFFLAQTHKDQKSNILSITLT